jgi:phage regulator Rha-like protein
MRGEMNNLSLKTIKVDGQVITVTDSREVALKTDKEHSKLLRDIRGYIEYLNKANFGLFDFLIEDIYLDSKGEKKSEQSVTNF